MTGKSLLQAEQSRAMLQFVRGRALDAYSGFEQIYMEVLAHLIGTDLGIGGIIYFRLTSAGLRNRTIEDLIERKHGDRFNAYWFGTKDRPALRELIRQIDDRRNQIVHWKPVFNHDIGEFVLRPPNLWAAKKNSPFLTIDDICEFKAKTDCVRHYAGNFNWRTVRYSEGQISDHARAWLDKFEQPPVYPPPDTGHPLSKLWLEQKTRPKPLPL
jgi:hypothetical protein